MNAKTKEKLRKVIVTYLKMLPNLKSDGTVLPSGSFPFLAVVHRVCGTLYLVPWIISLWWMSYVLLVQIVKLHVSPLVRSLSWSSRRRITSWRSADNLLQAARITSATWRHAQGANHRLYTAVWTKDSPNHTLKEPTYATWTRGSGTRIGCRWRGRFCNLREGKHKSKGVEISLWIC